MIPIIEVVELSHYYGNKNALDKISFSVCEGDFFCFLGPNGAGKSTTVKVLTGQLSLQQGKAIIDGQNISNKNLRTIKYHIGVLTDNMSLPKEFTVQELLYFTGMSFDLTSDQATLKSKDILAKIQLEEHAQVRIGHLSSGLLRRLEIGQALMNSAKILFLDEPTIFLDPVSVKETLNLIKSLNDEGITIFYTTHLLKEIEHVCTYLAIVEGGKILLHDRISRLREQFGHQVDIMMEGGSVFTATALFKQQGWKTSTDNNTISVSFPTRVEAKSSLSKIFAFLSENKLEYSSIGVSQINLDKLYAKVIAKESFK